jgi:hypothetical protein
MGSGLPEVVQVALPPWIVQIAVQCLPALLAVPFPFCHFAFFTK